MSLGEHHVTASLGIAAFPDDAHDATRLIRCADRALYRAKANGRNRVEFFSIEDATELHDVRADDAIDPASATRPIR